MLKFQLHSAMDSRRESEKENRNIAASAHQKPKRRNSIDDGIKFIPLKSMKLLDIQNVNNRISKIMVPFTFGYDGSKKTIKQSKLGSRRMSQWTEECMLPKDSGMEAVVDTAQLETGGENKSKQDNAEVVIESASDMEYVDIAQNLIDADSSFDGNANQKSVPAAKQVTFATFATPEHIEEIDLIVGSSEGDEICRIDDETGTNSPNKSKAARIAFRRKSARLSMSRDNLGSLFVETNPIENIVNPIQMHSKPFEPSSEVNKSHNSEPLPKNSRNKVVSQIQTKANESTCLTMSHNREELSQYSRRETVSELLNKPQNDVVKLWTTKKNSISDPLFYCFELVEQLNANTIKVACQLCDPQKEPLTCKIGSNSNLKTHLNRVSLILLSLAYVASFTRNTF